MATLARVLAFAVVLTLASALDQWGLFGCPDFKNEAVGIPYKDQSAMAAYITDLTSRFPLKLIAAAECEDSAQYSCITLTSTNVEYFKNGKQTSAAIKLDMNSYTFKGVLPKGLLGVPDGTIERTWTIVSDKDGVIVMKTCKGAFLSHFKSTYVFVDKTVDASSLDMTCLIPAVDKSLGVSSKPKGIC